MDAKYQICAYCKSAFFSPKCEKCKYITATQEVDERFRRLCQLHIVQGIELIGDKKISGK